MSKSDVERIPCSDKNDEKMALNAQGEKSETSKHRKQEGCSSQPFMPEETKNRWERDSSKRNGDIAIQKN